MFIEYSKFKNAVKGNLLIKKKFLSKLNVKLQITTSVTRADLREAHRTKFNFLLK